MTSLYTTISQMVIENCEGFIPIPDLEGLWIPGVEEFVRRGLEHRLIDGGIVFVQEHWRRTIPLLVYTLKGTAWDDNMILWICNHINERHPCDAKLSTIKSAELDCLSREQFSRFAMHRHLFTAPILEEGKDHDLAPKQMLPFIGDSENIGYGMSGDVTGHQVAQGHLILREGMAQGVRVAKKTVLRGNASTKIMILKHVRQVLLNEARQGNEICIAASISIVRMEDTHYAISLCAQIDLETILVGQELTHHDDLMDSIKEIKGIAGALEFLHQNLTKEESDQVTVYCHFDIKPANILVFRKDETIFPLGQWKLIDFGVSSISHPTKQMIARGARENGQPRMTSTVSTRARQGGDRYQAPKVSKDNKDDMGRGSDIWSLGCILVEVLAAKRGTVEDLRAKMAGQNDGYFFQPRRAPFRSKSILNEALKTWLNDLNNLPGELPHYKELFRACRCVITKMMQIKRDYRITAVILLQKLEKLSTGG